MTVARRRPSRLAAIAAPVPLPPAPVRPPAPAAGAPLPLGDAPAPDAVTPAGRLRRCTFRRIDIVAALPGRSKSPTYEVMCLYGGVEEPLSLGDLDEARPVCAACRAIGIFRPDEA